MATSRRKTPSMSPVKPSGRPAAKPVSMAKKAAQSMMKHLVIVEQPSVLGENYPPTSSFQTRPVKKSLGIVTPPVGEFVTVLGQQKARAGGYYRVLTPAAPSRVSDEDIAQAIEAARRTTKLSARSRK